MRHIKKNNSGKTCLAPFNENPPLTPAQARQRWSKFRGKKTVSQALRIEQYNLCAYSEIRTDKVNLEDHIEHIVPKTLEPKRTFDFKNLVISALSSNDLQNMEKTNYFGGHAKRNNFDSSLFISCLEPLCPNYFAYLSNGKIAPQKSLDKNEATKATYTIELLNLNSPYLINMRLNWIDELDELIDETISKNKSLPSLAEVILLPQNHLLEQFFTASRQRFQQVAEKVLNDKAPELL